MHFPAFEDLLFRHRVAPEAWLPRHLLSAIMFIQTVIPDGITVGIPAGIMVSGAAA